jgi:hypothetical protein
MVTCEWEKKMNSKTYFILAKSLGRVKIGKALNPEKRLTDLQTGAPEELELLLCLPNRPPFEESQLHYRFRKYRVLGEWFEYRSDLKSFIDNKIKNPSPLKGDDLAVAPSGTYEVYLNKSDRPPKARPDKVWKVQPSRYNEDIDDWEHYDPFDTPISQEWAAAKIN